MKYYMLRRASAFPFIFLFGLMSGYAVAAEWPRTIEADAGIVNVYQPQLETLENNRLTALAAVSASTAGSDELSFGAVWLDAQVGLLEQDIDRLEREKEALAQVFSEEMVRWQEMTAPRSLKRELASRNITMDVPSPEQVIVVTKQ